MRILAKKSPWMKMLKKVLKILINQNFNNNHNNNRSNNHKNKKKQKKPNEFESFEPYDPNTFQASKV